MAFSLPRWEALERARDSLTEAQWDALRLVAVVTVVAGVGGGGFWLGRPAWRRWQNHQALAQARHFAAEGDFRSMLLSLRRATEMAPEDPATWEEAARELAAIGSPEELYAQEELTRLTPNDPAPRLALAQEALRFGRYDTARTALDGVSAAQRSELGYHRIAAALALAEGRLADMKTELAAVVALTPDDGNAQFTFAALRIWSADPADQAAGRAEMERLISDPAVRVRAAIELIALTARARDPVRMHALLQKLLAAFAPDAAAQRGNSDVRTWNLILEGMKGAAAASPADTALMARWLADLGRRQDALVWLETLPDRVGSAPAPAAMAAQLAAEADNYPLLERRLGEHAWGQWPKEAWTLAIAAHRATGGDAAALWNKAIVACGDSPEALRNLGRLATLWRNAGAAEAAWSAILDRDPGQLWAFQDLRESYLRRGDYSALLALYARRADHLPNDEAAASDWILLACLLDRTGAAVDTRAENLSSSTPLAIVAKAAALWRLERPRQAEAKLDLLSADDRRGPQGSFWIAVVESDLGNHAAALAALTQAERTPRVGPEQEILQGLARRLRQPR